MVMERVMDEQGNFVDLKAHAIDSGNSLKDQEIKKLNEKVKMLRNFVDSFKEEAKELKRVNVKLIGMNEQLHKEVAELSKPKKKVSKKKA